MSGSKRAFMMDADHAYYADDKKPKRERAKRNRVPKIKGAIAPFGGRGELKYVDIASANYACDTTGTVTFLNLIAVGDDNTTRDGRQVVIKSVQVKGLVLPQQTTTGASCARILLVWDNAVSSNSLTAAQYIAAVLSASTSISFPVVDNAQRFTILSDTLYALGQLSDTATQSISPGPGALPVDVYRKMNAVTQYSGTTAAQGSIQNGGLFMITIGNQAAGDGSIAQLACRVRFTDA